MTARKKAREVADNIKKEVDEKNQSTEEAQIQNRKAAESALAAIEPTSDLAKMMTEDALKGAENIKGASLPIMKVSAAGKSSHVLADGTRPADGYFFYSPTGEEFKDLTAHILTVSKGFYLPQLEENGKQKAAKFAQMVGGMFEHPTRGLLPFVMFFQGKKWMALNEFSKEVSPYTRMRPIPVPMFQLVVKLTTHAEDNEKFGGYYHVIDFKVEKSEGIPVIVTDMEAYSKLRSSVENAEYLINNYIAANEVDKPINNVEVAPVRPAVVADVAPDDIPY